MILQNLLAAVDELPALVARLSAVRAAVRELEEIGYAGADALADELDNALEALDGTPGALLYLAGLKNASGDSARFERWDAGVAARMNVGELA